ncbi:MAG TPA: Calx-beta domain-containing protein, partial [Acidimicrobiales bacterium]
MSTHPLKQVLVIGAVLAATGVLVPAASNAAPQRIVRQPPLQFWEFREFTADGSDTHVAGNGTLDNPALGDGSPLETVIDWGRAQFDLDPDPPDFRANGRVFASSNGATFGVQAQSPTGDVSNPLSRIGDTTRLVQYQAFVKDTDDATLTFVVSSTRIDMLDVNGTSEPPPPQCPAQTPSVTTCQGTMEGQAIYSVRAYDADGTFYNTSGGAKVSGWEGNFLPQVWKDSFAKAPFWSPRNFTFEPHVNGPTDVSRASLTLNGSVRLRVDLSSVPVGGLFAVRADAIASAYDRRGRGEGSGVIVFLQDPVEATGTNIRVRGAHAVPDSLIIPPPDDPTPPVECPSGTDPRAGTLQFSASTYGTGEWAGAAPSVVVTRQGGSRGAIGATLTSTDGTAVAGADYTPVSTTVTFADGERTPQAITVPITPDVVPEDDKTVHLTLSDPVCTTVGAQSEADLTIVDDDRIVEPPPTFAVGGTVHGLEGHGLELANLGEHLTVDGDGAFQFPARRPDGSGYEIVVATQPTDPDQVCTVANGTGTIQSADVTNVDVECAAPPPVAGLDPTFGGDGRVTTPGLGSGRAVVVQPDGKVVVAGARFLARYLDDGTLDPDFGAGGTVTTGVDAAFFGDAIDVALQPDGMIVVAGVTSGGGNEDFAVERYDSIGHLDPNFNGSG